MNKAFFYIYETVDFPLQVIPNDALIGYKEIVVSIRQGITQIHKFTADLGIDSAEGTITASLSQEETGLFKQGKAELQVNIYYEDTERDTTAKIDVDVRDNLYKKVITDE